MVDNSSNKTIPLIRFKRFTEAWEQRKLVEELSLLKDGTHGTHIDTENGPYLLSAKNIKNGRVNITPADRKISIEEFNKIHTNFSLQAGDVLLTIVGSIGETAVLTNADNITFQRSVAYLRPKSMNSQFLYTTISGPLFQKELKNRQVVSAQPGIYLGDLAKIDITIPDIVEQTAIASFFKQLDDTIALHQRQLNSYKELKKGLMQGIFSQGMRFKDEDGNDYPDWEEKKLGELCNIVTGKLNSNAQTADGSYKFFTCSKETFLTDTFAFDTEALLIAGNGDIGYTRYYKGKFNAYQRTYVLDSFDNSNIFFIKYFIEYGLPLRLRAEVSGTAMPYIVLSTLSEMCIKLPSLPEQEKIASVLTTMDEKIETLQEKLASLKELKKGLLQQMFV